ncbi:MAG: hypothetical protein RMK29_18050 [Myxococcales bacterium]|nr:hypothetical protein [Myxococcota bacterium]MDW8283614.1 hypothetical protein [Myxococcales bacterium]
MSFSQPALLAFLASLAAAMGSGPKGWDYVITFQDLRRGLLEVDWTLRGLAGPVRLCADTDGAERFVRQMWVVEPGGGGPRRRLERQPGTSCWRTLALPRQPLRLRYHYDLAALAAATGDPDQASRLGDDYIFNDQAVLLRPDPLPAGVPIEVEFRLPAGTQVAPPWRRLPGPGLRFRYDSDHYQAGSYVAIGKLIELEGLEVGGGRIALHRLARPCRAADAVLREWVKEAATRVARFYGELPGQRVHVILAPVEGSDDPSLFGTILRRGPPSVVLYFGAESTPTAFASDWMATHELFHLGNPLVRGRPAWFIEGFTTYYQDVLRARDGGEAPAAMWADLADGFRRHCDPVEGASLLQESERLRQTRRYSRVYWGGACVAFLLDVAMRERGHPGLDEVMRALRVKSQHGALEPEQVIDALDRAAGAGMTARLLGSRTPLPLQQAYQRLGIEPLGPGLVRLRDDAPLSAVRRAMLGG